MAGLSRRGLTYSLVFPPGHGAPWLELPPPRQNVPGQGDGGTGRRATTGGSVVLWQAAAGSHLGDVLLRGSGTEPGSGIFMAKIRSLPRPQAFPSPAAPLQSPRALLQFRQLPTGFIFNDQNVLTGGAALVGSIN